jgi:hypothetical protein
MNTTNDATVFLQSRRDEMLWQKKFAKIGQAPKSAMSFGSRHNLAALQGGAAKVGEADE